MNKRGFTLVELLATIVILGLVITITATKGFGAFDNTKKAINEQNVKAIEEAAKVLDTEIDNCDDNMDDDLRRMFNNKTCAQIQDSKKQCIKLTINDLIENDYISGNDLSKISNNEFYICDNNKIIFDYNTYIEKNNPYSNTKSLVYNIINNSINAENGTKLRAVPLTKPAENTTVKYSKQDDPTSFSKTINNATDYYITYAEDYEIDNNTNTFTLINPTIPTSKFQIGDADNLKGKYIIYYKNLSQVSITNNLNFIYKVSNNLSDITETIKCESINSSNNIQTNIESSLVATEDDLGTSYYYRGGVTDNYVDFAGKCWRIVRIEGDGSLKLILEDNNTTCESASFTGNWIIGQGNYGYDANKMADYENFNNRTTSQKYLMNRWYTTNITGTNDNKVKTEQACIGDTTNKYNSIGSNYTGGSSWYYDAYKRLAVSGRYSPSLKCSGTKASASKVYPLTADEIILAGGKMGSNQTNKEYYLRKYNANFWGLSVISHSSVDGIYVDKSTIVYSSNGIVADDSVDSKNNIRPSISLIPEIEISDGIGTKSNPYIIKVD